MTTAHEDQITPVFSGSLQINGVTTVGGRMFGVSQGDARGDAAGPAPQVVEIVRGQPVPYPNLAWSSWTEGETVEGRFVGVNSIRVGPDGILWVVDRGSTGVGSRRVDNAPRLIGFDPATDSPSRTYDLQSVTRPWSFVDDVRFNGDRAYFTDCGAPAILVLELSTGKAWRVLEGHPATVAQQPLRAEHRDLATPDGIPVNIHVDQMEVSPDGRWLYFQPCCGQMSRVATALLDDPTTSEKTLAGAVEPFARTFSTGGTAIAGDGTIYASQTADSSIISISPTGEMDVLLRDVRLAWIDAMWIDDDGRLLMPSAQLNRGAALNWGIDTVVPPCTVYAYPTGKEPARS